MPINRREFLAVTAVGAVAAQGFSPSAAAEQFSMTRILSGFQAGTTVDVLARKVGDSLVAQGYTRATVVENKVGASGQLVVKDMKTAAPDGSTILLTPMSILGVYPHTYSKLAYDPIKDLTPVSNGVTYEYAIGVGTAVPESVKTIADLVAWQKADHKNAVIASPATGSTLHFVGIMLGRASGVELTHVGYKGSTQAIQDMIGGVMPAMCAPIGAYLPYIKEGKLRVLGTSGKTRSRFLPDVPTLAEQGYKDLVFSEWYGFYLPAHASVPVVTRLNAALEQALKTKDVIDTLALVGMEATPSSPQALDAALKADTQRWGEIVKSIGFKADS